MYGRVFVPETGRDSLDTDNAIMHTVALGRTFPVRGGGRVFRGLAEILW